MNKICECCKVKHNGIVTAAFFTTHYVRGHPRGFYVMMCRECGLGYMSQFLEMAMIEIDEIVFQLSKDKRNKCLVT